MGEKRKREKNSHFHRHERLIINDREQPSLRSATKYNDRVYTAKSEGSEEIWISEILMTASVASVGLVWVIFLKNSDLSEFSVFS